MCLTGSWNNFDDLIRTFLNIVCFVKASLKYPLSCPLLIMQFIHKGILHFFQRRYKIFFSNRDITTKILLWTFKFPRIPIFFPQKYFKFFSNDLLRYTRPSYVHNSQKKTPHFKKFLLLEFPYHTVKVSVCVFESFSVSE